MNRAEKIKIRAERVRKRNEAKAEKASDQQTLNCQKEITPIVGRNINLEIAIHCHSYQKRLTWMLNSILQQKGDIPNIVVSIAHEKNNGNPTTEQVIEFFTKKGLNIIDVILENGQGQNRAISRNIRTKQTNADWILFADSDLVYDPHFFENLKKKVCSQFVNETRVIGADRNSLDDKFCIEYFENDKREYPCEIDDVASIVKEWKCKWISGGGTAAGYFQLANVIAINNKGGFYSKRQGDIWRRTKSDRAFRCHMGGRVSINLPIDVDQGVQLIQYHLNHGRSIGEQR